MITIWNWFVKITAFPVQLLYFRFRVYTESKEARRRIKGPAILISNHTSVLDYAVYLFVFFGRTLRFQMAELLFRKPVLGVFLRMMGGIYVDRDARDFTCLTQSLEILRRGGVVGVFPEGRLPKDGEERPLPFKTGAAYLALASGVPVIPLYTNGSYCKFKRARVMIGQPFCAEEIVGAGTDEKEALTRLNEEMRRRVIALGALLEERAR